MYREAEIGCRRGWKQDLWEPSIDDGVATDDASGQVAAAADPNSANYWIDQSPRASTDHIDINEDRPLLSDDDLLNPRGTRNAREAMRRAREARKRELSASRRDPSDLPTFRGEAIAGEDSVIEERPIPFERPRQPLVPPVSLAEVRKHIDDARRAGHGYEAPVDISFREDDARFTEIPELTDFGNQPPQESTPAARFAASNDDRPNAEYEPLVAEPEAFEPADGGITANSNDIEIGDEPWEEGAPSEPWGTVWADQAPWPQDDVLLDSMPQPRPKRRGFLGSILHRREAAAGRPIRREEEIEAWEDSDSTGQYDEWTEPQPWREQPAVYAESDRFVEARDEVVPSRHDSVQLPPLPYDEEEGGEDYLLADSTFGERDDEDAALDRMPRICQTCRYLRPGINGPTCGAVYAQTYRRIVDLKQLSCASSIGAWWLPSDEYWESRVDISHHGDPTPLLEQFSIRMNEQGSDDDLHTT